MPRHAGPRNCASIVSPWPSGPAPIHVLASATPSLSTANAMSPWNPAAVQGQHELRPQPLIEWMTVHQLLQLADRLLRSAQRQQCVVAALQRTEVQSLQPGCLAVRPPCARELTYCEPRQNVSASSSTVSREPGSCSATAVVTASSNRRASTAAASTSNMYPAGPIRRLAAPCRSVRIWDT